MAEKNYNEIKNNEHKCKGWNFRAWVLIKVWKVFFESLSEFDDLSLITLECNRENTRGEKLHMGIGF